MKVKRIVANIETDGLHRGQEFYQDVLGLDIVMDHGWMTTYGSSEKMTVQVTFARQGGSGTPVPICRSRSMMSTPRSLPWRRRAFRSNMVP